jgi:tetratricopeptide (TPR) repeat protein
MGTGSSAIEKAKQIGNQYFTSGDYEKSLIAYTRALTYDKYNSQLLSNRSVCYLKLGNLKGSLEDATACVAASPKWNKGYYRLASVLKACKLFTEGLINAEISYNICQDAIALKLCEELKSNATLKPRNTVYIWGESSPRPRSLDSLFGYQIIEM